MIAAAFQRTARAHPDQPAVIGADGTVTTYAQLAARVARLAGALGPGPGQVGLLVEHGVDTITGMLAALTTGSAYVPLDPHLPDDRLRLMLADADTRALVVAPHLRGRLEHPRAVDVDPVVGVDAAEPVTTEGDAPAYILYTSGSTGVPKGVVQTHAGALFQIEHHIGRLGIGPGDRVSVLSSFGFDMAVTDTFSALLSGAAAVPVDLRRLGLGPVATVLADQRVSIYHSTPTVFRYLLDARPPGSSLPALRAVLLGGERVVGSDLRRFRQCCGAGATFINGYGATEISFAAQNHLDAYAVDALLATHGDGPVPVGEALPGVEIVLDGEEIVLRSRYLAAYWRDPARNAEKFRSGPDGVREYRTGDRGRWLAGGVLDYLGRLDRQVKIRGNRVEPAEVEAVLATVPGVSQALVVAATQGGPGGEEYHLTAYLRPAGRTTAAQVRAALARTLPEYAVPQHFVFVDDFPLTPTGKADTAALARLRPAAFAQVRDTGAGAGGGGAGGGGLVGVGPGGPEAALVREAWCAVLGVDDVPADTNFFDLGGHSLQMAQVQGRLESALGRRVALTTLYAHPTVRALAAHLAADVVPAGPDRRTVERMARRREARTRVEDA